MYIITNDLEIGNIFIIDPEFSSAASLHEPLNLLDYPGLSPATDDSSAFLTFIAWVNHKIWNSTASGKAAV
jgi:hypothetical protein